jgi:hypothetical protein
MNLLIISGNKDEVNKLFLDHCKSGHLELVESFFEPNGVDMVDVGYRDSKKRSCLFYAADGKGDNYDVVDLLLQKDISNDKQHRTHALFYFISKESAQSTKIKSIQEIFKRIDQIDLTYTDENGI